MNKKTEKNANLKVEMKALPYSEVAEKIVIGGAILENSLLNQLFSLKEYHFFGKKAQEAFHIIKKLAEKNDNKIDLTMVIKEAEKPELELWIFSAVQSVQTLATYSYYVNQLKELALRREISRIGIHLYEAEKTEDINYLIQYIREKVNITDETEKTKHEKLLEMIEEMNLIKNRGVEMEFGFPTIDDYVNGLRRKRLYVIGGLPSSGKTGLALQLARTVAQKDKKVLFFSLEISFYDAVGRLAATMLNIPAWKIQKPWFLSPEEIKKMESIIFLLGQSKIEIIDRVNDFNDLLFKIEKHKPDFVIVDHIQYLPHINEGKNKKEDRWIELGRYVKQLRSSAIKNDFCLLCLSQISREHTNTKKKPSMNWFQGSSGIEQQSDVALILYHENPENRNYLDLYLVKNRNGTGGVGKKVKIVFDDVYLKYSELYDKEVREDVPF